MRTIIILILYVVISILSIPMYLVEAIVRLFNKKAAAHMAQVIVKGAFNLVMFVSGCQKTILGKENIPADTPVMYAANHRSFYDIILAYATVPNQTAFISKMEIKKMPCVAQWMYFLNCLFMDRGDVKQNLNVILSAISLVKEGYSIYIAPEGTRNATDTLLEFKEGSMKIATKGKCPIIPVCLCNTENIFENNLPWIKRGKILIEYGKPIYPDDLDKETKKQLGAYVREQIDAMYKENVKKVM
ncbi:MAG: 1-acyl-sn-glycerol-3-phosphate acyltransferase [Eubacterium sp.]|nr:1-acyl-sn-glycerol-3-phosphate acyltransferase [Eubacterium sp.]